MSAPDVELYYWDGSGYTSFNAPIQSMSISRGRSRQLNRFESGSAVINFYNEDRLLDPLNTSSGYAGLVVPRVDFKVEADSIPIFTGVVKDWDLTYDLTGKDTATAFCSDAFTVLANYVFTEEVSYPESLCDERIDDVLDYFGYPGTTDLDVGNANLAVDVVEVDTQGIDYLFQVAQSDAGNFFVAADGDVTFVGRYGRRDVDEVMFADDGTGIGYSALQNQYGDELLFNEVSASSPVKTTTLQNTTSISAFGLSVLTVPNLLNEFGAEVDAIAKYLLDQYGEPKVRFTGLQVQLVGLSSSHQEDILTLDLASQVSVKRSFTVGSPLSVTQKLIVTGIRHQIQPGSHVVEFTFEPSPYLDRFVLGDSSDGILGVDLLG
jgi:hypothetical protein